MPRTIKHYSSFNALTSTTFLKRKKPRFSRVGWSADHLRDFADALPLFTNLKLLYLDGNNFGDEGARIVADMLQAPFVWSHPPTQRCCRHGDQCVQNVVKLDLTVVFLRYIHFLLGRSIECLSRDLFFFVLSCNLVFLGDARVETTQQYVELACSSNNKAVIVCADATVRCNCVCPRTNGQMQAQTCT